jgi:hypothetical protein
MIQTKSIIKITLRHKVNITIGIGSMEKNMTILELEQATINPGLAYALGLIYPLYKEKVLNGREYILGGVNHNSGKVTQSQLADHYKAVFELFAKNNLSSTLTLKTNKCPEYTITAKEGFTVLIDKTNVEKEQCLTILTKKVKEISVAEKNIKTEFVKGCFDGRSSFDTTYHFLALDVDRNYGRQDLIIHIIESLQIELNVNRREINHSKNDQIRIKPANLLYYISNIGMYSSCRKQIIEKALHTL